MVRKTAWLLALTCACGTAKAPADSPDAHADAAPVDAQADVHGDVDAQVPVDAQDVVPGDADAADVPACTASCDDGNPCTDDSCSTRAGCIHTANSKPCDDGKACTSGDHCAAGVCQPGSPTSWQVQIGGPLDDAALSVVALGDGGLTAAGWTESKGAGKRDAWLLRTDATGKTLWDIALGGPDLDEARALRTVQGGYVFAGSTRSKGAGNRDAWLVRTDDKGQVLWESAFGGAQDEEAYGLATTADGFLLAGYSDSQVAGSTRLWLVRSDAAGKHLWSNAYGSTELDAAYDVIALADGGFAVVGETSPAGLEHLWLLRIDADGKALWDKSYHGTGNDTGWSIAALTDGTFALAGYAHPSGEPKHPWLVHAGTDGTLLTEQTYGDGEAFGVATTATGLVLVGTALQGGKTALAWRGVTLDGKTAWSQQLGGGLQDAGHAIAVFQDGSLGIAGTGTPLNDSHTDAWLVRTGPTGAVGCP
jgi:hypothetical protein